MTLRIVCFVLTVELDGLDWCLSERGGEEGWAGGRAVLGERGGDGATAVRSDAWDRRRVRL